MPVTLIEAEIEKTSQPARIIIPSTPRVAPARPQHASVEQFQNDSKLFWMIAPISLLITGCTAFLMVRRWLNECGQNNDQHLA
ncbi:MAG TPA: hypothetical protein VGD98_12960 [Ktedonobacteraceae bacterium]